MCLFWVPAHVLFSSRLLLRGSRGMVLLDMDCSPLHLQQVWSVWKGATNWLHEFFSEITENPTLDCWNWPAVFTIEVLHWDVCARTVAARQPCTMPHRLPSSLAPRGSVLLRSLCNGWHMLARWLHLKCFQTMCTSNYQRFHFSKLLMGTCHFYRMLAGCFVHGISCVGWCRLLGPCPSHPFPIAGWSKGGCGLAAEGCTFDDGVWRGRCQKITALSKRKCYVMGCQGTQKWQKECKRAF